MQSCWFVRLQIRMQRTHLSQMELPLHDIVPPPSKALDCNPRVDELW